VVVHEGKLASLRRFKDDVSEVKAGFECGMSFERYQDLKVGDVIEIFMVERVAAAVS
jgi:translation initiation factor IF-2